MMSLHIFFPLILLETTVQLRTLRIERKWITVEAGLNVALAHDHISLLVSKRLLRFRVMFKKQIALPFPIHWIVLLPSSRKPAKR